MIKFNTTLNLFLFFSIFSFQASAQNNAIRCSTVDEIKAAMANAKPGDEIIIESGTYAPLEKVEDGIGKFTRFTGGVSGTSSKPIILRGERSDSKPILRVPESANFNSPVMSITGDYWVLKDLIISHGKKGLMLDTANNNQLIGLEIHTIAEEGLHLRSGSSYNLVQKCKIYNVGLIQPGFGEGIYVGSDRKAHGTYAPDCNFNTIENCIIGPDVRAEGIDIKEGTIQTIVRNNVFSGKGISGENSADAFIDLKGERGFIYKNVFNRDGSSVIASGIDFQQRTDTNSGYRNAIFNNTFNFGNGGELIPTARKKGGSPTETHIWNNNRIPSSPDFPNSDGTEKVVAKSCPGWNIISCSDGNSNTPPVVSLTSPSKGSDFAENETITISASASDSDGSISKVEFFNGSLKIGEDTTSPYTTRINNALAGSYILTARATDNKGATSRSGEVKVTVTSVDKDNVAPVVSFKTPTSNTINVAKGYSLIIEANANDEDGSIANVQLFIDGNLIRQENFTPYEWGHATSPNKDELNGLSVGIHKIILIATDNEGTSTTSSVLTVIVTGDVTDPDPSGCKFGTPLSTALPEFDRVSYTNVYVLGSGGPDVSQIRKFTINWNPVYNGLYQFAINTKNGKPEYYISLKDKVEHTFGSSKPSVTISGSGLSGFDGDYWVAKDGDSFVMVSKTDGYAIYFSNNNTPPNCKNKSNLLSNWETTLSVYPNPAQNSLRIIENNDLKITYAIINVSGKVLMESKPNVNTNQLDISRLRAGMYFLKNLDNSKTIKFIKK